MIDWIPFCLFAGAVLFALLSGFLYNTRSLWALLSALCAVIAVLGGLALGMTLGELLTPVLAVCAAAMAALLFGKGGGKG